MHHPGFTSSRSRTPPKLKICKMCSLSCCFRLRFPLGYGGSTLLRNDLCAVRLLRGDLLCPHSSARSKLFFPALVVEDSKVVDAIPTSRAQESSTSIRTRKNWPGNTLLSALGLLHAHPPRRPNTHASLAALTPPCFGRRAPVTTGRGASSGFTRRVTASGTSYCDPNDYKWKSKIHSRLC